mmetsp:Transcript_17618/g.41381  ORF Transcript_17618/g.41381 Transcript_17618/m.41381 type:complete len:249 (-) Transcript_17618:707-1453(-)
MASLGTAAGHAAERPTGLDTGTLHHKVLVSDHLVPIVLDVQVLSDDVLDAVALFGDGGPGRQLWLFCGWSLRRSLWLRGLLAGRLPLRCAARWQLQPTTLIKLCSTRRVIQLRVLLARGLCVPEPPSRTRGRQDVMAEGYCCRVSAVLAAALKRPCQEREGKKLAEYWACAAQVLLEVVRSKLLLKILDVVDEDELLLLAVSEDVLGHARNGTERRGEVADVELEDASDVMVAHDRVNLRQRPKRHLG